MALSRRKTQDSACDHVTLQDQFIYEWKEAFGECPPPQMQFMQITLPQNSKTTEHTPQTPTHDFNEIDAQILTNLEKDLKDSTSKLLQLRNDLKRERHCQEWLKKEILRYHRFSEGCDTQSTGSEGSELNAEEEPEHDDLMSTKENTPRTSLEDESCGIDSDDAQRLIVKDESIEPLYDNIQDEDSSDEDMEGIYENLDFLKNMQIQQGDVSNDDSESEDVFPRSPDSDLMLTTSMRVSTAIDLDRVIKHRTAIKTKRREAPPPPLRDRSTSLDSGLLSTGRRDITNDAKKLEELQFEQDSDIPEEGHCLMPDINLQLNIAAKPRPTGIALSPTSQLSPEIPTDEQLKHRLSSPEVESLNIRRLLLSGTLESELKYIQCMEELQQVMKIIKANMTTSQPMLTNEDYDTLFFKIPELCMVHREFCNHMGPKLSVWTPEQTFGDSFKLLASHFGLHEEYVANYKKAMSTLERLKRDDERFAAISASIKLSSGITYTMESMLNTPLQRITKLTLVLSDLLKRTPPIHPDFSILAQVLEKTRTFFKQVDEATRETDASKQKRRLIKDSYLVEFSEDRKLRHILLWSDLIICTKEKSSSGMFHRDKAQYDCQWCMPLTELSLTPNERSEAIAKVTNLSEEEMKELKKSITELKAVIRKETYSGVPSSSPSGSFRLHSSGRRQSKQLTRTLEGKRKELATKEGLLVLESPKLSLTLYHVHGNTYTLLMSSDYERSEWKEAILTAKRECRITPTITPYHIEKLLTKCKRGRKINNIGSILIKDEEELLFGTLHVTVHQAKGLTFPCQLYCCVEVDSYGIISLRARTRKSENSEMPTWHEEFGLEVEGAQTLRILCYDFTKGLEDEMIDKGAISLTRSQLGKKELSTTVKMEKLELDISLRFESTEKVLKRVQSRKKMGVFGVRIEQLCQRGGTVIPNIVARCVEEVEKRGMNEMGIYRISGSSADINMLKKLFEINSRHILNKIKQYDIHAVAGLLKRYFRDLPEPLFTQNLYSKFLDSIALTDPDAKRECMLSIMSSMPEPNKSIIHYIFGHLKRIANNEAVNKMHLHNLATVFGPTLIGPAYKPPPDSSNLVCEIMGMSDAMTQVGILYYYLEHYNIDAAGTQL